MIGKLISRELESIIEVHMITTQVSIGAYRKAHFAIIGDNDDSISIPSRICVQSDDGFNLTRIDLGPATVDQIEYLQSYLERLKIHCSKGGD